MKVNMAFNVFRFCTGLRIMGSLMILVVLSVVGVSAYAMGPGSYGPELLKGGTGALWAGVILTLFLGLLAMLLWSYFTVVLTDPGGVPPGWSPAEEDVEGGLLEPSTADAGAEGGGAAAAQTQGNGTKPRRVRFCRKCNSFKPPRCHHCSVCGRCILKMDHHCVWVVNCVGARNYKAFLLFLLYTFLETLLVVCALLPYFIAFVSTPEDIPESGVPAAIITTFLSFIFNLTFMLSVLGFLMMHMSLVNGNMTTIEAYEKKPAGGRWRYDVGRRRNFEQVFGTRPLFWFLPLYAEEDHWWLPSLSGLEYPVHPEAEALGS